MTVVGYARVSTREQNPAAREAELRAAGAERVFVDHGESSRAADRPQWLACRAYLRTGDTLVFRALDRLAGSEVMAVFAQLRVDTIRENTRRGLAYARAQGRVGGRPTVMGPERTDAALRMKAQGQSNAHIATVLGVSTSSVRRALVRAQTPIAPR
ncbi:MAG: recombinase family protein [Actinomyces sp.]|jgi:DNA invertase Pin-like site-specific DNA recombinase|nr:recombinase family protein [Actinomyces sp.]MCI1642819.1 recombinase family protein [Actinomyces sp.]